MTDGLDVLVIESHPRAAADAARDLEAHGHRVHRCYENPDRGFPCRGLSDPPSCPVDGPLDVALVVRTGFAPAPSYFEEGVTCAVRAKVPVVEQGTEEMDPFRPWLAARIGPGDDVTLACENAAAHAFDPVRSEVRTRIARLLGNLGISPADAQVRFETGHRGLDVHLDLPVAVPRGVEQALAVRVLDGLRGSGRTFGRVDVHVHAP